jgi:phosphate transport system permease protein
MAVIMVAGNSVRVPTSMLQPVRTLTANIALEMGYAAGNHARALFATALVLLGIVMGLNLLANLARKKRRRRSHRLGQAGSWSWLAWARRGRRTSGGHVNPSVDVEILT